MYKLKQPQRRNQPVWWWTLAIGVGAYLLLIMLYIPMTRGDGNNLIGTSTYEYFLWTAGAVLAAILIVIPVVRNDNKYNYTMALLWANRHNILDEDFHRLLGKLKSPVFKKGNCKEIQAELQGLVNKYEGKDMRIVQYNLKPEYAENLEKSLQLK